MMDKVIATIGKNALEQLQIAVKEYQGHTYVDIRLFFLGDDEQWHPTKKGITISPALWPEFQAAVGQVDAHLPAEDAHPPRRRPPRGAPHGVNAKRKGTAREHASTRLLEALSLPCFAWRGVMDCSISSPSRPRRLCVCR